MVKLVILKKSNRTKISKIRNDLNKKESIIYKNNEKIKK